MRKRAFRRGLINAEGEGESSPIRAKKIINEREKIDGVDDFKQRVQDLMLKYGRELNLEHLDSIFNALVLEDLGFIPEHQLFLVNDTATSIKLDLKNDQKRYHSVAIPKDSNVLRTLTQPHLFRINSYQVLVVDISDPKANFITIVRSIFKTHQQAILPISNSSLTLS